MADQNANYLPIFPLNYSVTGIRSENADNTQVIMTGSCPVDIVNCPSDPPNTQSVQAMLYRGPMDGSGQCYPMIPDIGGTVCSSIFYGPNTHYFNPNLIEEEQVRAVGSYNYGTNPLIDNHGMMYEGPLTVNGTGGTWTPIDMPASKAGGGTVINTVLHSTMGDLIVGNYERVYIEKGIELHEIGAFIYKINLDNPGNPDNYQKLPLGKLVTAYGIWQNGNATTSYTIAGGLDKAGDGFNVGYLVGYNSGILGAPTTYESSPDSNLITHFEGITNLERGMPDSAPNYYSLAAIGDENRENRGAAFAEVKRLSNNSFGPANWKPVPAPSGATANTVLTNNLFGVYTIVKPNGSKSIQSYWASNL